MAQFPNRKLQVFISSTYVDLRAERQSAVTAILESGHIPAGMELFAAGDEEQLTVIRRWIDRSDIFLLILGRCYGSIEPNSGSSYVQLEYEHARSSGKPFFALVLSDAFINSKIGGGESVDDVTERTFPDRFKSFQYEVTSRICRFVDDEKDIRLAVAQSVRELQERNDLVGWVSARDIESLASGPSELSELSQTQQSNQLDPPFEEASPAREARQRAIRLAASDLPIMILGEPGTGRRTLAATFAHQRAARTASAVFMIHGVEGLTDRFRRGIRAGGAKANEVLIHHLESLAKVQQTELAVLVHSKQLRLTAVARLQYVDEDTQTANIDFLSPELDAELRSMTVTLPALRDRGDDSVQWAQHLLTRAANRLDVRAPSLTSRAISAIAQYRWPGNLIELDAVINRALCLSSGPSLEPSDLGLPDGENAIQPLAEAVEQFQVKYVDRAIAHFSGNRTQAARALGVDPRTVFRYLERRKR